MSDEVELNADEMPCVYCGIRPWGFGYCGEECAECAGEES